MANVQHASLPDAELHEPKGVVNASSGEVYVADGSNSGAWTALVDMDLPKDVTGTDGYIKLPGGVILQWGRALSSSDSTQTFSFPTAFTTVCWNVSLTWETENSGIMVPTLGTSSFTFNRPDGVSGNHYFRWFAIGY